MKAFLGIIGAIAILIGVVLLVHTGLNLYAELYIQHIVSQPTAEISL